MGASSPLFVVRFMFVILANAGIQLFGQVVACR